MMHAWPPTRRVELRLDGQVFDEWTVVEITRDLSEISGSFRLELRDGARSISSWPFATLAAYASAVVTGLEATIAIDGEPVLVGWIDEIAPAAREGYVAVSVEGRDRTGDLVDCTVAPDGPTEFMGLDLLQVARRAVEPFGVEARAEADVGDTFDRYTFDVGETALSAIEKGARQRALLVTSDGVGALVLSRSGSGRAPGDIVFPGSAMESAGRFSARDRHSDYRVKGQAEAAAGTRADRAPLDAREPPAGGDAPVQRAAVEERGALIHAQALDPEVQRFRPLVSMARTQLRQDGAETQADWMMRTARAASEKLDYEVKGYRGASGELWRPNELVFVDDRFLTVHRDMLIAGVVFVHDERGARTRLRITGPDTYDQEPVGDRRVDRPRGAG